MGTILHEHNEHSLSIGNNASQSQHCHSSDVWCSLYTTLPATSKHGVSTAFPLSMPILTLTFLRCMMPCFLHPSLTTTLTSYFQIFWQNAPGRLLARQECQWCRLCLAQLEKSHSSSSGRLASTTDFCLLSIVLCGCCKILLCQLCGKNGIGCIHKQNTSATHYQARCSYLNCRPTSLC